MAKPILTILLKGTFPENFRFVETLLQPLGLLLANPDSGRITHWSDDGRQIAISRSAIVDEASAGVMKNVQFCETGCDDLFVSWLDASSGWEFSFHLNGVTPTLKIALANILSNAVLIDLKQQYEDERAFRIDFDEPADRESGLESSRYIQRPLPGQLKSSSRSGRVGRLFSPIGAVMQAHESVIGHELPLAKRTS